MNRLDYPIAAPPEMDVFFTVDSYVRERQEWARQPVVRGIEQVLSLAGVTLHTIGDTAENSERITDELASSWNDEREQVNVDSFKDQLRFYSGVRAVIVTAVDLYTPNSNFVFGSTLTNDEESVGLTVISTQRFNRLPRNERNLTLNYAAKHEFGHLVGLDSKRIKNQDRRRGSYSGHCLNECVMQQSMSLAEAYQQATKLSDKPNHGFCSDCTDVASTNIISAI